MKKFKLLLSFILVTSILTITGCSGNKDQANTPSDDTTTSAITDTNTTGDETTASPTEGDPTTVDFSAGLDENGFLQNITALDYMELPDYMNIKIPSDVHTIPDEIVNAEVDKITANLSTTEQVTDRAIVDGDTVNIDYVGSVDGVDFEGGSTGGAGTDVTIGVTSYIDDFLQQLVGHKPGESFDIEVTFPDNYGNAELSGKDAVFAITVNYIVEKIAPEVNDEFVTTQLSAQYGWTTVDEMKTEIKTTLQEDAITNFIQSYLLDNTTVSSTPEEAITYQQNAMLHYYEGVAAQYGMSLEDYLSAAMGVDSVDAFLASSTDQVKELANFSLILQAIAEKDEITISEDDIALYFLVNLGTTDYAPYIDQYGIGYVKNSIVQSTVLENLRNNAELE